MKTCLICGADLSDAHALRKFCYTCQQKKEAERPSRHKPGGYHKTDRVKKTPDASGRSSAIGLSLAEVAAKARQAGISYGNWVAGRR